MIYFIRTIRSKRYCPSYRDVRFRGIPLYFLHITFFILLYIFRLLCRKKERRKIYLLCILCMYATFFLFIFFFQNAFFFRISYLNIHYSSEFSDEVKNEVGKRVSLRFRTYFAFPQFEITVPYLILHSGIFMLQKW